VVVELNSSVLKMKWGKGRPGDIILMGDLKETWQRFVLASSKHERADNGDE
jgi:hypothetical protein